MKFIIMGAGIAGCESALELAKLGKVILVEKRSEILSGSSDNTQRRLGLGFHYSDIATAKFYLHASIKFLKKYPGFIVGQNHDQMHPYRRGRYFVVKNSLFPLEKISEVYSQLRQEYQRLITLDPSNKILGEPECLFRFLDRDEYCDYINEGEVIAGIETAEQVLDWPQFKKYLIKKIESNTNITVYRQSEIVNVKQKQNQEGYVVLAKALKSNTIEALDGDFVVNCTWEQIEAIDDKAGLSNSSEIYTNRLKMCIEIQLPDDFEQNGPVHSMFFCFGPFCSFTNLGNGKGLISYEPVSKMLNKASLKLPQFSDRLIYLAVNREEIERDSREILKGITRYIPKLKNAQILNAMFGIVKTKGTVDIYSAYSPVHERNYSGVEAKKLRWIDNSCMKLLYFVNNGQEVVYLVKKHLILEKIFERV